MTAFIILVLGWFGVDLQKKKETVKKKTVALKIQRESVVNPTPAGKAEAAEKQAKLRRKNGEIIMRQLIRALGGTAVLLVLAIFTPPVSTCLLPPCKVPAVVQQCVPLLVSFFVSAFIVVNDKFVSAFVEGIDFLLHHDKKWTRADLWNFLSKFFCIGAQDAAAQDAAAQGTAAPETAAAAAATAASHLASNGGTHAHGSPNLV